MTPLPILQVSLPIEYLHLETGAILLFLAVVIWAQFRRAGTPTYDVAGSLAPLRLLPIFFVLLAVQFARMLQEKSPLLGIELAAGITLSLLHPVNALCFMVHLMILRPWEVEVGNPLLVRLPRLTAALCVVSYLIHPKHRASLDRRNRRAVFYVLAFCGWVLLTVIKIPGRAAVLEDWFDTFFKSLTAFGMALFFIESDVSVREFELTLAISSLALMSNAFYRFYSGGMTSGRLQSTGLLGDPNDLGAIIVMALPFVVVPVFQKATGLFARAAGLLYAGLAAFVIWLTRSRGTMLAIVGQFLAFRAARAKRIRVSLVFTACLLGAGYVGLMHLVPRDEDEMAASQDSRLTYWKTAVNMAVHNPILGVGFRQYPENYMSYAVGTIYERGIRTAHSSWFLALGETGFVGFFFYFSFFSSVARMAWRSREKRPAQLYALTGYGVAMSFLSHTYSMDFFLLTGLIIASNGVKERIVDGV